MTAYFVDTSALAKRYVAEVGSIWINAQLQAASGNVILISELTMIEFRSVLARRLRAKSLSANDNERLRTDFLLHFDEEYLTVTIDKAILARAADLVEIHPLFTLDAIQLASAVKGATELGEVIVFVSADTMLLNAAQIEGFAVDNPLLHR